MRLRASKPARAGRSGNWPVDSGNFRERHERAPLRGLEDVMIDATQTARTRTHHERGTRAHGPCAHTCGVYPPRRSEPSRGNNRRRPRGVSPEGSGSSTTLVYENQRVSPRDTMYPTRGDRRAKEASESRMGVDSCAANLRSRHLPAGQRAGGDPAMQLEGHQTRSGTDTTPETDPRKRGMMDGEGGKLRTGAHQRRPS